MILSETFGWRIPSPQNLGAQGRKTPSRFTFLTALSGRRVKTLDILATVWYRNGMRSVEMVSSHICFTCTIMPGLLKDYSVVSYLQPWSLSPASIARSHHFILLHHSSKYLTADNIEMAQTKDPYSFPRGKKSPKIATVSSDVWWIWWTGIAYYQCFFSPLRLLAHLLDASGQIL